MKKSKAKSKSGRGGARPGAGRPRLWKHGPLKMVRLPVAFVEKILEIAQYMDQNDGQLPFSEASEASMVISGHPSERLSEEKIKELLAKKKAQKLAQKVMVGDEEVSVSDATFKELYELPDSWWGKP
jgi:hypothetical protein